MCTKHRSGGIRIEHVKEPIIINLRMTIHYSDTKLYRLFFIWKGSVWKMVYRELILFLICFYILHFTYRFGLNSAQQITFRKGVKHVEDYRKKYIPVSFLLGFYVTIMVTRWWRQFEILPWPDRALSALCFAVNGTNDQSKLVRATVARYLILSTVLAFRDLSTMVRKRFPTLQHLQQAELMTMEEMNEFNSHERILAKHAEMGWIMPIQWSQMILAKLVEQKVVVTGPIVAYTFTQLLDFQTGFKVLYQYAWANLPLVYTHVVALAVYTNFFLAIVGQQFVDTDNPELDYYIPFITLVEMMFYMGWFKVGLQLMIPYGEDDNDFNLNFLIDRHWLASLFFTRKVHNFMPSLSPPDVEPIYKALPHTITSGKIKHDSVKLPAKFQFDKQKYRHMIGSSLFEFILAKDKRNSFFKKRSIDSTKSENTDHLRNKTETESVSTSNLLVT